MLLTWLTGALAPALAAHAVNGAECHEPSLAIPDEATRVGDHSRAESADHCALCHFYRDLRTAQVGATRVPLPLVRAVVAHEAVAALVPALPLRQATTRAPPASAS